MAFEKQALQDVLIFSRLSDEALIQVQEALQTKTLAAGDVLFDMGDPGDELYVVQEGRIAIYVPGEEKPGEEQPIRIFESPEVLGEMALIDRKPRSASARALEPSRVLVLTGDDFRRLLRDYPDMALAVMTGLNDRIRYTTDFLGEVRMWVQRVAEGQYERRFSASTDYQDRTIEALAAEFAQMAAQVQQREEELRREVERLRIQIDQDKREDAVTEITESDYFQSLRQQAKKLRSKR